MDLPYELLIDIFALTLNQLARDDIPQIKILSLVSRGFNEISNESYLWKKICMKFNDYARLLKRYKAIDTTWKQLCRERLSFWMTRKEILIGDPSNPDARYLLEIDGSGQVYIGAWISLDELANFEPFSITQYEGRSYLTFPICWHEDTIKVGVVNGEKLRASDMSICVPFVLILKEDGAIAEFMFRRGSVTGDLTDFSVPRLLPLTEVDKVFAFEHAMFALRDGYCWAWSVIDHPFPDIAHLHGLPKENIKTLPIAFAMLSDMFIYHITAGQESTRMYYTPRTNITTTNNIEFRTAAIDIDSLFIDVLNVEIMSLIADSVFSEEQTIEMINKLQAVANL